MDRQQLRRALFPASLLLLIWLFVYSCVPKPITNLDLVAVSRISAAELPPSDLREPLAQRGEAIWKVSLIGDAHWIEEVRRHELSSYATVVRCDQSDHAVFSLGPYIGHIPVTYQGVGLRDYRSPAGSVQYDIYVPETGRYRSEADFNAPMPSYDLNRQPLTLCFRIAGGAMHGAYNRSNEVRVEVGRTN